MMKPRSSNYKKQEIETSMEHQSQKQLFYEDYTRFEVSFVEKWPMMNSNDILFIMFTYFLFVFKVGPYFMDKRDPIQIKRFLIFYNLAKVVNSAYLSCKFLSYILDKGLFPRHCEYDDRTIYTIAALYWKYMATKIVDLFDTVFFVLRKKYTQVTFLHVYHHVFMVIISWCCLKYDPSDHWAFMAVLNCFIHTAMYTYYGLAAMGPEFSKYLWWKKYLTMMQMIQFFLVICHVVVQTYTSQCPMHTNTYWIGLGNLSFFIVLFAGFYKRRYQTKEIMEDISLACARHID